MRQRPYLVIPDLMRRSVDSGVARSAVVKDAGVFLASLFIPRSAARYMTGGADFGRDWLQSGRLAHGLEPRGLGWWCG